MVGARRNTVWYGDLGYAQYIMVCARPGGQPALGCSSRPDKYQNQRKLGLSSGAVCLRKIPAALGKLSKQFFGKSWEFGPTGKPKKEKKMFILHFRLF